MTNYLKNELDLHLKNDEELYDFVQKNAKNGLWFWDLEVSNFCWISTEIELILGYNAIFEYSVFVNQLIGFFIDNDLLNSTRLTANNTPHPEYLLKYIHQNGSTVAMNCVCKIFYDAEGNPNRVLGANTLAQHYEFPLVTSDTTYQSIGTSIKNSKVLFVMKTDIYGNYNFINDNYHQLFCSDKESLLGTNAMLYVIEEDHEVCRETIMKCFRSPLTPFAIFLRKINKHGEIITNQWEFTALIDDEGKPFEVLCIGYNVSDHVKIENDLSVLVANMTDLLISVDDNGVVTYVSPNVTKLYHYELNEIVGKHYIDFIHHQDLEIGIRTVKNALISGVPFKNLEIRLKEKHGSYYWTNINSSINPLNKETIMVLNDITARKHAEIELTRTKTLLQETNQVAKIGGWELNISTGTLYWSKITKEIHELDELYQPTIEDGINFYKDDRSRKVIANAVESCINFGTPYDVELELITATGKEIWVRSVGKADFSNPNRQRIYGTFQNITETKLAEEQLKKTKDLLEQTNKLARIGGWSFDVATRDIYWSDVMKEILEVNLDFNPTFETGIAFYKEGFCRELIENAIQNCIEYGTPFEVETKVINTSQKEIWVKLIGKTEIEDNKIKRIFGTFQDIHQSKVVEENNKNIQNLEILLTKEKQLNQLKSRFISLTSHEFRTPLSVILGSTELLDVYISKIEDAQLKDKTNKQLENIITQVNRLTGIITDILNLEKTAEGKITVKKEPLLIKAFLEKMAQEFQYQPNEHRNLTLFLPSEEKEIISDESILRHVMNNLIGNAFKYSRGIYQNPEIHLTYFDNHFCINVKDYGIGIPQTEQKYLFETFFRASNVIKTEGTGLGLNIAKEFTEKLQGEISFESEEGKGCKFTLIFPYSI
ncbi:PAS domain-containing protein [Arcicella aquatica]|uniref:histidine kinase n=1 Tax=Arcicella aquatica TaxID=217141 RepID=A0ABU5QGX3_9BACT|nr:PAS domain-containing protein [Arcicella aquatica]MEA5256278.1 PAS domain-containing protein [Arcicella aquatica]